MKTTNQIFFCFVIIAGIAAAAAAIALTSGCSTAQLATFAANPLVDSTTQAGAQALAAAVLKANPADAAAIVQVASVLTTIGNDSTAYTPAAFNAKLLPLKAKVSASVWGLIVKVEADWATVYATVGGDIAALSPILVDIAAGLNLGAKP